MIEKRSIYNEYEALTEEGEEIERNISLFVKEILKNYPEIKRRDLRSLFSLSVGSEISSTILVEGVRKRQHDDSLKKRVSELLREARLVSYGGGGAERLNKISETIEKAINAHDFLFIEMVLEEAISSFNCDDFPPCVSAVKAIISPTKYFELDQEKYFLQHTKIPIEKLRNLREKRRKLIDAVSDDCESEEDEEI